MATFLYDIARQGFLTNITVGNFVGGQIDWVNDTFGVALVDTTTYSASQAGDQSVADILTQDASAIFSRTTLTGTAASSDDGTALANNAVFSAVAGPGDAEAVVIYRDAGVDADNVLIAYIDSSGATNLPVVLNGGDVTVVWDNGSGRIFKL